MPTEIVMPALEMAQETGTLVRWLKREGEWVSKGEPLMEIETDKVTVEIEAPASGVLSGLTAHAGDTVPVGRIVGLLLAEGELPANLTSVSADPPARQTAGQGYQKPNLQNHLRGQRPQRVLASPKARRLAAEGGLNLAEI